MALINPAPDAVEHLEARGGSISNPLAQAAIWSFYQSNPDRVIVKVGGFLKIRVRDLRILFELLAGPEPR